MKVVFSDDANADLDEIGDYIASDSPRHALKTVRALAKSCRDLSRLPEGFPVVAEARGRRIRRRPSGSYAIFYTVRDDRRIEIVRILHSARDHERILFPEN